jgi:hypothetical protein
MMDFIYHFGPVKKTTLLKSPSKRIESQFRIPVHISRSQQTPDRRDVARSCRNRQLVQWPFDQETPRIPPGNSETPERGRHRSRIHRRNDPNDQLPEYLIAISIGRNHEAHQDIRSSSAASHSWKIRCHIHRLLFRTYDSAWISVAGIFSISVDTEMNP